MMREGRTSSETRRRRRQGRTQETRGLLCWWVVGLGFGDEVGKGGDELGGFGGVVGLEVEGLVGEDEGEGPLGDLGAFGGAAENRRADHALGSFRQPDRFRVQSSAGAHFLDFLEADVLVFLGEQVLRRALLVLPDQSKFVVRHGNGSLLRAAVKRMLLQRHAALQRRDRFQNGRRRLRVFQRRRLLGRLLRRFVDEPRSFRQRPQNRRALQDLLHLRAHAHRVVLLHLLHHRLRHLLRRRRNRRLLQHRLRRRRDVVQLFGDALLGRDLRHHLPHHLLWRRLLHRPFPLGVLGAHAERAPHHRSFLPPLCRRTR
mmetsp:Transcript_3809/g.11838  ORF Transcript_3809/g.11838 Transcript_3809/m.11838 type:complete len:315 (+) Transcript_3809:332-1276(+)